MRHRQTKGPDTDRPNLNHRVTSRLYTFGVVTPICGPNIPFHELPEKSGCYEQVIHVKWFLLFFPSVLDSPVDYATHRTEETDRRNGYATVPSSHPKPFQARAIPGGLAVLPVSQRPRPL
jgi:hypothetical protein